MKDAERPPAWGPSGETVYQRTYQREKQDGSREAWAETVARVVRGNLSLVYGPPETWSPEVHAESDELYDLMYDFKILPAGRHLWASGVPGRQYLFNCHVSGWGEKFSEHFEFSFMRLMEGGGVGANYSSHYLRNYSVERSLRVHIVCDPSHPDYEKMKAAGVLSEDYSPDWPGAFEIADNREGWAAGLVDLLDTYTACEYVRHADRVYDVTNVRCEGSRLKTFGGRASGPLPFARMMLDIAEVMNAVANGDNGIPDGIDAMEIDHAIASCVVAGGNRRSARMSMMRWDDPCIFEFIKCKTDTGKHWTTNISVEIDDEFLARLNSATSYEHAREVLKAVTQGMLENGEPGFWNSTLSNEGEPNKVICTNPCGEISLEAWENCNLGHVNLDAFSLPGRVDVPGLEKAHRLMTRFLMRATFGDVNDPKQAEKLARNRRVGVGHFGVQGFLAKQGVRYSQAPRSNWFVLSLRGLRQVCRDEARKYAFELRIPEPVKVTTVAPTGTIAKLAGRTEGIHPIYARYFIRRIRFSTVDPDQREACLAFWAQGYKVEEDMNAANTMIVSFPTKESLVEEVENLGFAPEIVESADEISLEDMLEFQACYQENYADNAVSFTVNFPKGSLEADRAAFTLARFLPYLKGTTLMPDESRPQSPYERITQAEYEAAALRVVADGTDDECANGACPVR